MSEPSSQAAPQDRPKTDSRPAIGAGLAIVAVCVGGFVGWATTAEIASGAIAGGEVAVESRRQTVEATEGGAISDIMVRDGDRVEQGAVLVRLDRRLSKSDVDRLQGRDDAARVRLARLRAELIGAADFALPMELNRSSGELKDARLADVIATQRAEAEARARETAQREEAAHNRIQQLDQQIAGDTAMVAALDRQISLAQDTLKDAQSLLDKGLTVRTRVADAQAAIAALAGQAASRRADIARAHEEKAAQQLDLDRERSRRRVEIATEMDRTHDEILEIEERLQQALVSLERMEVRAPVAGVVVGRRVNTTGADVQPGDPLLDIVPDGDRLMVEARVSPTDVDHVHVDMTAEVRFPAFTQRTTPTIEGRVATLGADVQTDPATGARYYASTVAVSEAQLARLKDLRLVPGMPAEVIFLTGERTPWDYIFEPVMQALGRAMRDG